MEIPPFNILPSCVPSTADLSISAYDPFYCPHSQSSSLSPSLYLSLIHTHTHTHTHTGHWLTPGIAHILLSLRLTAINSSTCLPSTNTGIPCASHFHLQTTVPSLIPTSYFVPHNTTCKQQYHLWFLHHTLCITIPPANNSTISDSYIIPCASQYHLQTVPSLIPTSYFVHHNTTCKQQYHLWFLHHTLCLTIPPANSTISDSYIIPCASQYHLQTTVPSLIPTSYLVPHNTTCKQYHLWFLHHTLCITIPPANNSTISDSYIIPCASHY